MSIYDSLAPHPRGARVAGMCRQKYAHAHAHAHADTHVHAQVRAHTIAIRYPCNYRVIFCYGVVLQY